MKTGFNFGKIAIFHSQTIIFFQPKYVQLEMSFYRPEKFPERKLIQRIRLKFVYRCFIFYPFSGDLFRELCQLPSFTVRTLLWVKECCRTQNGLQRKKYNHGHRHNDMFNFAIHLSSPRLLIRNGNKETD